MPDMGALGAMIPRLLPYLPMVLSLAQRAPAVLFGAFIAFPFWLLIAPLVSLLLEWALLPFARVTVSLFGLDGLSAALMAADEAVAGAEGGDRDDPDLWQDAGVYAGAAQAGGVAGAGFSSADMAPMRRWRRGLGWQLLMLLLSSVVVGRALVNLWQRRRAAAVDKARSMGIVEELQVMRRAPTLD
jgi:hypothetical protein